MNEDVFFKPKAVMAFVIVMLLLFTFNFLATFYVLLSNDYIISPLNAGLVIIISTIQIIFCVKTMCYKGRQDVVKSYSWLLSIIAILFLVSILDSQFYFDLGVNMLPFFVIFIIFYCFPSYRKFNKFILEKAKEAKQ